MKTRFNPKSVYTYGLSKREARLKIRRAYNYFHMFDDIDIVIGMETGSEKKKRKKHTSRRYVRENIDRI